MTKKTLEEKIKQVGFWTVTGIFSYLMMAFFMKSNYPIYEYGFNRSVAYDVIKDALTLGAAFLAPVAAFVLFIDWKTQHKEVNNEKNSRQIIHACDSCRASIMNYVGVNFEQQYSNFMNNFFTLNTLNAGKFPNVINPSLPLVFLYLYRHTLVPLFRTNRIKPCPSYKE